MTYYQNVAPILQRSCAGCHKPNGIAPFDLTNYDGAKRWAQAAVEAVEAGEMPPWSAQETAECRPRFGWKDDLRVSAADRAILQGWLADGKPAGDASQAAALPQAPDLELKNANVRLKLPTSVNIDGKEDQFLCFSLDPQVTQDVWVDGSQITAGNPAIVHHVLLYVDPKGESAAKAGATGYYPCFGGPGISGAAELIGAWAPGALPSTTPPDVAILLKAGSRIIMNVHYHPTGSVQTDSDTAMQLRWSTTPPKNAGRLALIGNFGRPNIAAAGGDGFGLLPGPNDDGGQVRFHIPAGAKSHVESMRFKIPGSPMARQNGVAVRLWTVGTHMHYLGRDMKIDLVRPVPTQGLPSQECLVQTPKWDFDWQRGYTYDAPLADVPSVYPGDELHFRCTYDNSLDNPALAHILEDQGKTAPVDVELGEGTLNEMCLGVFGVSVPLQYQSALYP
ncbi:MAG: hypothetical protein SF187_27540 [Deltaproteobacteria bacterium]|nr:hypothetical protein [Deltaproteobacteria bacterium]